MSKLQKCFIDLCLQGAALMEEVDDYVDKWHDNPAGLELHDYLGMTEKEYSLWLRDPDMLPYIIKSKEIEKSYKVNADLV